MDGLRDNVDVFLFSNPVLISDTYYSIKNRSHEEGAPDD